MSTVRSITTSVVRHALVAHAVPGFGFQRREPRLDRRGIGGRDRLDVAFREVVLHIDQQAAERRGDAGIGRHDHDRDRQFARQREPVQRARAAERDERKIARIVAAADRDQPHRVGHVGVGDTHDRLRRLMQLHAKFLGNTGAHRVNRLLRIKPDRAARKTFAEPPEHDIGIGVGRHRVAAAVARRPGIGAGRLRAVAQRPALVDPGERAAAGADRQHLDAGKADRVAELDVPVFGDARLAFPRQRHVATGAAHVEADRIREAALQGDVAAGDRPGGDAGARRAARRIASRPSSSSPRRRCAAAAGRAHSRRPAACRPAARNSCRPPARG